MSVVVFEGVHKRYGETVAVRGLDLSIQEGETFVLVGESGSGKTTALRLINRLEDATAGRVKVFGRDVQAVDGPSLRCRIGYVIQGAGLFGHMKVRDNVAVVPRLLGWDEPRIAARTESLLEQVGLPWGAFSERYPSELSGGQRQRVGIARALASDPDLVLLDEPFGALDPVTKAHMQDEFIALSRSLSKTFVVVTHDLAEAVRLGDRVGVMLEGALVRLGTPAQIVGAPEHPFVEAMLGRNRLQLRWMTIPLADVCGRGRDAAQSDDAPRLAPSDSVWDALSRCEAAGGDGVVVEGPAPAMFVSRQILIDATAAPGAVIK